MNAHLPALEDWCFNVRLECLGRSDAELEVVLGGAILDLRDLDRILEWTLNAQGIEARQGGDSEASSVHESPAGAAGVPE